MFTLQENNTNEGNGYFQLKSLQYGELRLKRSEPGETRIHEILGEHPKNYYKVSGEKVLEDVLPELRSVALSQPNRKFSAVLVILENNELGIITTGTLTELIIQEKFDYKTQLKEICEPLHLVSGEEDYGSVRWNNFGIIDKNNNLILVQSNPSYTILASQGNYGAYVCG